jgi:mRNA-degrading endonuclease RelE of RelBE toxin-antitoxin system
VTWNIDFTTRFRADVVGLDANTDQAIMDALVEWMSDEPPRENARSMIGIEFYEATIADRFVVAYSIDDVRQRFVVLWLRPKPGSVARE